MSPLLSTWAVPSEHPAFPGHFPGNPIVPGVVLLDRVLGLLQAQETAQGNRSVQGWTVSQVKFLSPVGPGDVLSFEFAPDTRGGWRFVVHAEGGRQVASGGAVPAFS